MFRIPRPIVLQVLPLAVLMLLVAGESILWQHYYWHYSDVHFAFIAVILLSVWMWLQWPRRSGTYIGFCLVLTVNL